MREVEADFCNVGLRRLDLRAGVGVMVEGLVTAAAVVEVDLRGLVLPVVDFRGLALLVVMAGFQVADFFELVVDFFELVEEVDNSGSMVDEVGCEGKGCMMVSVRGEERSSEWDETERRDIRAFFGAGESSTLTDDSDSGSLVVRERIRGRDDEEDVDWDKVA